MKKKPFYRHFSAVLLILVLSVLIGFLYSGGCTLIERMTHPLKYADIVKENAKRYAVPENVIFAVIKCESGFDASAESGAGAIGLMQLLPVTYEELALREGESPDRGLLYDPKTNIRYGTYLLSLLYERYGNWETAYAAYNAGEPTVNEWLDDPAYADGEGRLKSIPYRETRNYVKRIQKARQVYERLYGKSK